MPFPISTRGGTPRIWSAASASVVRIRTAGSQQRFSEAQAAGRFDAEIVPVELKSRKGTVAFERDEHNRPDATAEGLAKLGPAFRKEGTITAGNAPGLNTRGDDERR